MIMIKTYIALIRNAEALGGKKVSHDAVKNMTFKSLFKSCQGVRVNDIVCNGSELQTVGTARENARLAITVRVRGTASITQLISKSWLHERHFKLSDI